MSLDLHVQLNRAAFQAGLAQAVYALITLLPTGPVGRLPLDLRLVLDHSGSMASDAADEPGESKLERLQAAVCGMVDRLEAGDRLRVVAFSHTARVVFDDPIQTVADRTRAKAAINKLRPDGGTSILAGLEAALKSPVRPDEVSRLVLVTDGEGNDSEEGDCRRLAAAQRGGMGWLVYGTGIDYNDRFLDSLAQANGGQYTHLSDWRAAADGFVAEVEAMTAVALKGLVLELESMPGVAVTRADRIVPQIQPLPCQAPGVLAVDLGDLDRVRGQKLLVQLALPPQGIGTTRLATIRCAFNDPSRKQLNQLREAFIEANFTVDAGAEDAEVLHTVQLAGANRLCTLGLAEAADGRSEQGGLTLASAAGLYDQLGLPAIGTRLKTLSSKLATQGALDASSEEVRRTLTTMTRQAWQGDPDA